MIYKMYYYRVGTKIFELKGQEVDGVRWPVVACLIDHDLAAKRRAKENDEVMVPGRTYEREEFAGERRVTRALLRRQRKEKQRQLHEARSGW